MGLHGVLKKLEKHCVVLEYDKAVRLAELAVWDCGVGSHLAFYGVDLEQSAATVAPGLWRYLLALWRLLEELKELKELVVSWCGAPGAP